MTPTEKYEQLDHDLEDARQKIVDAAVAIDKHDLEDLLHPVEKGNLVTWIDSIEVWTSIIRYRLTGINSWEPREVAL